MVKKFFANDLILFVFILVSLASISLLAISASVSTEEALYVFSPFGVARIVMVSGISAVIFFLVKGRRKAVHDQHLLKVFLESAGEGIFAIDREFSITLWNRSAENITGHQASDVIGRPLRDIITFYREHDRAEDIVFVEEAMLYGEKRSMSEPMYLSRKDGKEVPVGDSAAPIVNDRGAVVGCIVVFRDATNERKQQALRSEFAYASHQLKTPVTKALWSLEAALDKEVADRKDLSIALSALKSIRKLSTEIVDVSEIDQGLVHARPERVSVVEVIEEAVSQARECLSLTGATVSTDGISIDTAVKGDVRLLARACLEILCNASLYGAHGGTIRVSTRDDGTTAVLSFADEGIGIPGDEQTLVFSKFFRGSNIDKAEVPGAGLGLYIAKRYVGLMGGKVWFTSTEKQGSVFHISLPLPPPAPTAELAVKK